MKKHIIIVVCVAVFLLLAVPAGIIAYNRFFPDEYVVAEDEIALRVQLDTAEDIGLLVYDYEILGHDRSGGMSNADRSMIKHDDELIIVWNREELETELDEKLPEGDIPMELTFRIITEYTDPNFENIYPEDITVYLDPMELDVALGQEYRITITGDSETGYQASPSRSRSPHV